MLCSCVQLILEFGTLGDLSKCKARDGSGQNPTRILTRPEAVLANPTRTIFQRTRATRGNILFDPSNPNFLKKFYSQTIKCK